MVSSAYCDNFISFGPILMPLIDCDCLIALPNNSIASTNNNPDSGHPCRTPLFSLEKGVANPLFITQLDTSR